LTSRRIGLVVAIGGVFAGLAATSYLLPNPSTAEAEAQSLLVLGSIGDFELTAQDGKTFSSEELAGQVWVADFIFTRCPSACPEMTSTLAELFEEFGSHPDLRMVSISVDAEYDSPEVLSEFAAKYDADPNRWHFLSGPNEYVQQLSVNDFQIAAAETPASHSLRFILVDRRGDIRGYYHSNDPEAVDTLRSDIAKLLPAGA